jgi:hypothetical protein
VQKRKITGKLKSHNWHYRGTKIAQLQIFELKIHLNLLINDNKIVPILWISIWNIVLIFLSMISVYMKILALSEFWKWFSISFWEKQGRSMKGCFEVEIWELKMTGDGKRGVTIEKILTRPKLPPAFNKQWRAMTRPKFQISIFL